MSWPALLRLPPDGGLVCDQATEWRRRTSSAVLFSPTPSVSMADSAVAIRSTRQMRRNTQGHPIWNQNVPPPADLTQQGFIRQALGHPNRIFALTTLVVRHPTQMPIRPISIPFIDPIRETKKLLHHRPLVGSSLSRYYDPTHRAYFSKGSPPWGEYFVSVAARAAPALGTAVWANRMSFASIFFP